MRGRGKRARGGIENFDRQNAMPGLQGQFDRIGEARAKRGVYHWPRAIRRARRYAARPLCRRQNEAIDDDINRVRLLLVERGDFFEQIRLTIDLDARKAVALQGRKNLFMAALLSLHDRREEENLQRRVQFGRQRVWQVEDRFDDLLGRLARDGLAAVWTVRRRERAVEDAEVVVDLRDGRDNGARIAARRVLFNGNGRGQALDLLDVGLFHAVEKLPRIGGKRLDVAALALGIERVKGKG